VRICSVDPDVDTPALALFVDRKLTKWTCLKGKQFSWITLVPDLITQWEPDLLVIEAQYIPRMLTNRAQSIFQLVAARAMICGCFILAGIPWELVEPFSWMQSLGGAKLGREQLKIRSFLRASDIAQCKIESEHVADSICIGQWWISSHISKEKR
jgi:hypothetical protein